MTAIEWIVEQIGKTNLPGTTPRCAYELAVAACDKVWRSSGEIARRANRNKSYVNDLLRYAVDAGQIERIPGRGNLPAQYRRL